MSLESEIQNLTAAVENLAFIIKQSAVLTHTNAVQQSIEKTTLIGENLYSNVYAPLRTDDEVNNKVMQDPAYVKPNPVVVDTKEPILAPPAPIVVMPAPMPVAPPAVAMPPVPTFTPPAAPVAPLGAKAPFSDAKGLMDYLMKTYGTLGPEKGAKIQEVMKSLGANAVNEVTADKYDALFAGVEALK